MFFFLDIFLQAIENEVALCRLAAQRWIFISSAMVLWDHNELQKQLLQNKIFLFAGMNKWCH